MAKKSNRNTRGRIVSAAWKLFYEQGYEDTTVEEIIELSGTSKGSFYHYFDGKDALLSTLSSLFDEKYEELTRLLTPEMTAMEQLLFLNRVTFSYDRGQHFPGPVSKALFYPADYQWGKTSVRPQPDLLQAAAKDHRQRSV